VEAPFVTIGQISSFFFFLFFAITPIPGRVGRGIPKYYTDETLYGAGILFLFFFLILTDQFFSGTPLSNPILVLGQFSGLLFLFYFKKEDLVQRELSLFTFFLSILASLYLRGTDYPQLFFLCCYTSLIFGVFPIKRTDFAFFALNLIFLLDPHLARWGFYQLFFLLCYDCLTYLFKNRVPCPVRILGFLIIGTLLFIRASIYFGSVDALFEGRPLLRLLTMGIGAIQIYICIQRPKAVKDIIIGFCLFLVFGAMIDLEISLYHNHFFQIFPPTPSFCIFMLANCLTFLTFCFLFFQWGSLRAIQPLVPIYFALVVEIWSHFPELAPISRWKEGFQLLFLLLSILFIVEARFDNSKGSPSKKKKDNGGGPSV
jgi:hypothetical protein